MNPPSSSTVFITGTSSGFGKLIAITLANAGYRVFAGMRDIKGRNADSATSLIQTAGISLLEVDVTSSRSVNAAVSEVLREVGCIDVLICNAGISGIGLFEATSIDRMKKIFEVNLRGAVRCMQAALPAMRANGYGLIINISSVAELFPVPYLAAYSASKSALGGITDSLRDEVSGYGIDVVTVLPGPFPTEIGKKQNQGSNKPSVAASYGSKGYASIEQVGQAFEAGITKYQAANQEVADVIFHLICLQPASRPAQVVINRLAEGTEQELTDLKSKLRPEWLKRMGLTTI